MQAASLPKVEATKRYGAEVVLTGKDFGEAYAAAHEFAAARELLATEVPGELWAHRARMFERHLPLPIRLA